MNIRTVFFLCSSLTATAAQAVTPEQQWGDWYGYINAMEFEISTDNTTGERLTLTCSDEHMTLSYSVPAKDYRASATGISINGTSYATGETAFIALKNTNDQQQIEITMKDKPLPGTFKTAGLREALNDLSWQDCITH
ncbi:hypothetical protein [Enterobacillus tribolii]|uniref:Uncharacterized protein n=2 Tax=Enterobacterales TaxID=91347 RepID=A0A370QMD0_9GAMM|nr:hypothetical protein [Enterobacillus tribolii]MBW7982312.1 hypothetical protein [Enterobacillus tribolii]RDK89478.1 hypothetical protein C8D90_107129 [Enterobacillus tribolii]